MNRSISQSPSQHEVSSEQRKQLKIRITSLLGADFLNELEQLLFFNPQQGNWRRRIVSSVERLGNPRLVERQGGLRVEMPGAPDSQTLYALAESSRIAELAGLLTFNRNNDSEFEILHLAVRFEYSIAGGMDENSVAFRLVGELRHIARQVKGIQAIRLPYQRGKVSVA